MKVGIVCACDAELAPFLPALEGCRTVEKAMLKFHEGRLCGVEVVAVVCGVCKVNAAIASQLLIDDFAVGAILNSGTAGGMDPRLRILDTVISTEVCYHDVAREILTEFHPWMASPFFQADPGLLELSRAAVRKSPPAGDVFWGRMVTGEAFIADEGRQAINDAFAPLTVDMETASIAHVCYVNGIPFLSIRCVTDTADHSGVQHFEENCARAAVVAQQLTAALLREIRQA